MDTAQGQTPRRQPPCKLDPLRLTAYVCPYCCPLTVTLRQRLPQERSLGDSSPHRRSLP
ncbi:hypothetical protein F0726_01281 [Acidithiobacillus caldus]|nr:hypothetical protein F0726_01281 [Acidithiobacillus caldus]